MRCNKYPDCTWKGELRSFEEHTRCCTHIWAPCKKCDEKILKDELSIHASTVCILREYSCPNCSEKGTYHHITGRHVEVCPGGVIHCGCGEIIARRNMEVHHSTCPKEKVSCPYLSKLGYNVTCLRGEIKEGDDKLQSYLDVAMASIRRAKPIVMNVKYDDIKKGNRSWCSEPYFTHHQGYEFSLSARVLGDLFVKISIAEEEENKGKKKGLLWPLKAKFTVTLLNQLRDAGHKKCTICVNTANKYESETSLISNNDLGLTKDKQCQYLSDGLLYFRVETEFLKISPWLACT